MLNETSPNINLIVGEPIHGVNLVLEGLLGNPNPSANPIGEYQANGEAQSELVYPLFLSCKKMCQRGGSNRH